MLKREVDELCTNFATVVEALRHQKLVVHKLETMLLEALPNDRLRMDAFTQTDTVDATRSAFLATSELQVRVLRTRARCSAFRDAAAAEQTDLEAAVIRLREAAADAVPAVRVVDAIVSSPYARGILNQFEVVSKLFSTA